MNANLDLSVSLKTSSDVDRSINILTDLTELAVKKATSEPRKPSTHRWHLLPMEIRSLITEKRNA